MKSPRTRALFGALIIFFLPLIAAAQSDTAQLFVDAAKAREEAALIWEGLGERIRAAEAWGEAAVSWERAAKAWESAGEETRATEAWDKFRAAIAKRDQAEIRMVVVSGDRQNIRVGRTSERLVARVTDRNGTPIPGIKIIFDIASRPSRNDGAMLIDQQSTTDSKGEAGARLKLGTVVGDYSVLATVPDLARQPAVFSIRATAGAAAKLEVVGGNNQVLKVNQRAIAPLVVAVTDLYGNPVEGEKVEYRIVSEPTGALGQSLTANEIVTDAAGIGGVRFQAGNLGGSYIVLVEGGDLEGSPAKFELIVRQTIPTVRIVGFRIEGTLDSAGLVAGTPFKVGETFLLPEIGRHFREELHRFYATGRFEDVMGGIEDTEKDDEKIAVITVVERSRVGTVNLEGLKKLKKADISNVIGISDGSPYSVAAVERSRVALEERIREEGYLNAVITVETTPVEPAKTDFIKAPTGRINVTFRVVENEKVKVSRMNLNGNRYYSDWNLNWHMKTGSGRVYKELEFEEDRQKILGRYIEHGFLSATMEDPVVRFEKGRMILDVNINEGPQYKIGEVTFTGNTAVPEGRLRSILNPRPGSTFRARKFFESIEKMRTETARFGHAEARVLPQERLDPRTGLANFDIRVVEGPVLYLDHIEIEGNVKTQERIVRREINLRPGDRLNGEELEKARKRLEALGFFEPQSVRMDLRSTEDTSRRVLSVKIVEGKTGQLQFGAGYSSADKLVGFLSLTKKNFDPFDFFTFTGAGQEVSVSAEYGGKKNSFTASWTEPYFRNRPISIGFDAFNTFQEREGFDWVRRGGAARLSHRFGAYNRLTYRYGLEEVELLRVTSGAPSDVQVEVGFPVKSSLVRRTASLTTTFARDTRDDGFFPTNGSYLEISNQLAGRFLGGNVSFNRPVISYSKFSKGLSNHVIALRGQYGTISNFFERENPIPTTEKFYLGGANTVRGYRERSLQVFNTNGTIVGPGRSYALANAEYRIPFTDDKSISMAFFYDVGGVYEGEYEFGIDGLSHGIGAGVRFNTPLGPIRLDYGYALSFPAQGKGQLHFSIGQAF